MRWRRRFRCRARDNFPRASRRRVFAAGIPSSAPKPDRSLRHATLRRSPPRRAGIGLPASLPRSGKRRRHFEAQQGADLARAPISRIPGAPAQDASLPRSGDQRAVEHLVDDGPRDPIDEIGARLRVLLEELNELLLTIALRLPFFLPELFTRSRLVFLNDLVTDPVDQRVLLGVDDADADDRSDQGEQVPG